MAAIDNVLQLLDPYLHDRLLGQTRALTLDVTVNNKGTIGSGSILVKEIEQWSEIHGKA